jgi:hypothetical protein
MPENPLVSQVVLLADAISTSLDEAKKAKDMEQVQPILTKIGEMVDQLVVSAKNAEPSEE